MIIFWLSGGGRDFIDRGPKLSKRHVFTLTGVYEGRKATSRKQPRRAAGRLTSASRRGSPTQMGFIINNFSYNWPCIQKRAGVALGHRRRLVVRRRREHVFIVVVQPVVETRAECSALFFNWCTGRRLRGHSTCPAVGYSKFTMKRSSSASVRLRAAQRQKQNQKYPHDSTKINSLK